MTTRYAAGTAVSVEKSRGEIEVTLKRFGAEGFMYGYEGDYRIVSFKHRGRLIRFQFQIPTLETFATYQKRVGANQYSRGGLQQVRRTETATRLACEGEERRLWRSLANAIKAKLDSVESGIMTFEEEFLAYTVTPSGQTVAELLLPQIDHILESGQMPALMPGRNDAVH